MAEPADTTPDWTAIARTRRTQRRRRNRKKAEAAERERKAAREPVPAGECPPPLQSPAPSNPLQGG